MRELDGRRLVSRTKGRGTIERSLRALLIRVHRFGRLRATTPADHLWAARVIDGLQATLDAISRRDSTQVTK